MEIYEYILLRRKRTYVAKVSHFYINVTSLLQAYLFTRVTLSNGLRNVSFLGAMRHLPDNRLPLFGNKTSRQTNKLLFLPY